MGWLRAAVGAALIIAPGLPMRLGDEPPSGASLLLMRTIGIRDLVLGIGTVAAVRSGSAAEARRWTSAGLASDSLDTALSLVSVRSIGTRDSLAAAGLALSFAVGDVVSRRRLVAGGATPVGASSPTQPDTAEFS
jgi:hypothetical protein